MDNLKDDSFDTVVSFQVIEHIQNDKKYLEEIYRVLKPGGMALISTPNIRFSLTRNPWHIREYTPAQLKELCASIFDKVEDYYNANKESVNKITRWDVLNLQYRLPAWMLRIPYEILNRANRDKLHRKHGKAVEQIEHSDYLYVDDPENALDLYYILHKK